MPNKDLQTLEISYKKNYIQSIIVFLILKTLSEGTFSTNQNIQLYILDEKVKIHNYQNLLNNIAFSICFLHETLMILHLDGNSFLSDMIS